jgi:hypothetical protein
MATIKEFKKWLEQFPEDTIVEVAIQESPSGWESCGPVRFQEFEIPTEMWGDGFDFLDFRNSKFSKPDDPYFGKCFLELGEIK